MLDSTDQSTIQQSQCETEAEEEMQIGPTKSENRTYLDNSQLSALTGS